MFSLLHCGIARQLCRRGPPQLVTLYCTAPQQEVTQALKSLKPKSVTNRDNHFVDWCKTTFIGGSGGNGMICFLQLKGAPMLGPAGGDGGNGGHILIEVSETMRSLSHIKAVVRAENGEMGKSYNMTGGNAPHTVILVPSGTLVKNEEGVVLRELKAEGEHFIAARGGAGGKGNAFFLSNKNRHPQVAQVGGCGEVNRYHLELRLMAHAGLIGFPNAGKSTLLRAISRARPKVAAYPFTTLNPYIGMVQYDDFVQVAVADLPGLLPGAHKNYGLGISFLRHVERCLCLFYVVDMSSETYPPQAQLDSLCYELEQYKKGLSTKPCAILANKMDLPAAQSNIEAFEKATDLPILPISGRYGKNLITLLKFLRQQYDTHNNDSLVL